MKITKYICDKCGKEIKNINQIYKTTVQEGLHGDVFNGVYESCHLCENCAKALLKWLKTYE